MRMQFSLLCAAMLWCSAAVHAQPVVPLNQGELAQRLADEDEVQRHEALIAIRRIPPAQVGQLLRVALIAALARENAEVRRRADAMKSGAVLEPKENAFYGDVLETVVTLREPTAIPALSDALGTGMMAIKALAAFGEIAAPSVLFVVNASERPPEQVGDGLAVLRLMTGGPASPGVSSATRAKITQAAQQRLKGRQSARVLLEVIDLAANLKDPDLTNAVEVLANDASAIAERGVEDAAVAQQIQQRATDTVTGLRRQP